MGKWAGEKMAAMARLGTDVTLERATQSTAEMVVMETKCCNNTRSLSSTEVECSKAPGKAGSDCPSTGTVLQGGD